MARASAFFAWRVGRRGRKNNRRTLTFMTGFPPGMLRMGSALFLALAAGSVAGASPSATPSVQAPLRTLRVVADVPAGSPRVSIAGTLPEWGPWQPDRAWLVGEGSRRETTVSVPAGTKVEFKLTLGSWAREAVDTAGQAIPNYSVSVEKDTVVYVSVPGFRPTGEEYFATIKDTGLVGRLELHQDMTSQFIPRTRSVFVWLPPGYDEKPEQRYSVLYMHDGQNLFDPRVPSTQIDWGVDEVVTRLVEKKEIEPLIVVGLFNTSARRAEYNPLQEGPAYARFLIEELKPMVDAKYRTLPDREHTGVMGSSRGGMISLYIGLHHSDVFSRIGCLSTHYFDDGKYIEILRAEGPRPAPARFYFDYGTREPAEPRYPENQARMTALLRDWKWQEGKDFTVFEDVGAEHNEAAWRARLDRPMKFLFGRK